jgi:hypothetical protein
MAEQEQTDNSSTAEIASYYPEPYWRLAEGDWLKTVLLFFDRIAILLPAYMRGRESAADPVLAGPLTERGLLQVLEPETFVDQVVTESLTTMMVDLITQGAFDHLERSRHGYQELSRSRLGWNADVELASMVVEELQSRGLAHESRDGLSVPLHPVVRTTVLVLLSQLARSAGMRHGLDLHPITADRRALDSLIGTLSLSPMPSLGHVVALDLEAVALDLAPLPLDDVLDFRGQHTSDYRRYMRDVRRFIAELSPLPRDERERLLVDRREELADRAHQLRRLARRRWIQPLASVSVGAAGAAWFGAHGDPVTAALSLAAGVAGAAVTKVNAEAYSYFFTVERELSRPVRQGAFRSAFTGSHS